MFSSPPVLWAIGLIAFALAIRASFIGLAASSPDTADYLARMEILLDGEGFQDAFRTPALIVLLAGIDLIGADQVVTLVVIQNLIGVLMPGLVLLVGWRLFNPATGVIAGFLTAASPILLLSEQFALTDYLFGVTLFIGAALLAEGAVRADLERPATRLLVAAGALFGLATLFRGNGQLAFIAVPIALLLALRNWRPALRAAAVTLGAMIVVLAPWIVHNIVSFGTPQVTTLGGYSLYLRVVDHDRIPPPEDSADGRLARSIYDKTYAFAPPEQQGNSGFILAGALEERGKSQAEATSAMTGLALEAIREHPSTYASNSWDILRDYRRFFDPGHDLAPGLDRGEYVRSSLTSEADEATLSGRAAVPGDSRLTRAAWRLAEPVERLVYLFSLGGLAAFALIFVGSAKSRIGASVFITFASVGMAVGALSLFFEPRYGLPFASMTWLLMAAVTVGVLRVGARAVETGGRALLSSDLGRQIRFPDGYEDQGR
jgi:4-amino-4-deoxy-L-arabinose transferase-like glycosyltransferase